MLPNDGEVLLIVDNVGIVVDTVGQPSAGSLLLKDSLDSLGQTGSYVLMAKSGQLELYDRKTGFWVQLLCLTVAGHSVIADDIYRRFIVIGTGSKVSCLQQVPVEEQLKALLRKKDYDEAVNVTERYVKEEEASHVNEILSLVHVQVPRNRYWGLHPPSKLLEDVIKNGLLTIQSRVLLKKADVGSGVYAAAETKAPST